MGQELLRSIRNLLPNPTPEQQSAWDEFVRREQERTLSPTKKRINSWIDDFWNFSTGFLVGPEDMSKPPSSQARGIGELMSAGIPFAAYPLRRVFHGTQRLFDKFDPSRYDTSDVLGWLTHFAEDPTYAGRYAMGQTKGIKHIPEEGPLDLSTTFYGPKGYETVKVAPHTIPAQIEAKNVLDLVDPHPDDISQALAALNSHDRQALIGQFKRARAGIRDRLAWYGNQDYSPQGLANELGVAREHLPDQMTFNEIPIRVVADKIRLDPETFKKTPFDAIRYRDNEHKSWAVPEGTPIRSEFGHAFAEPPKKLKVVKTDDPRVGAQNELADKFLASIAQMRKEAAEQGKELGTSWLTTQNVIEKKPKIGAHSPIGNPYKPAPYDDVLNVNFDKIFAEHGPETWLKAVANNIKNSANPQVELQSALKKYFLSPADRKSVV